MSKNLIILLIGWDEFPEIFGESGLTTTIWCRMHREKGVVVRDHVGRFS